MKNLLWKIRMFFRLKAWKKYSLDLPNQGFKVWYSDVFLRNPDENYCCSGYLCGCEGKSVKEMFDTLCKRP